MDGSLIDVCIAKDQKRTSFQYCRPEYFDFFISAICNRWQNSNYNLPEPNQLFCVTTNSKGASLI
jgi:hypothetical protein